METNGARVSTSVVTSGRVVGSTRAGAYASVPMGSGVGVAGGEGSGALASRMTLYVRICTMYDFPDSTILFFIQQYIFIPLILRTCLSGL